MFVLLSDCDFAFHQRGIAYHSNSCFVVLRRPDVPTFLVSTFVLCSRIIILKVITWHCLVSLSLEENCLLSCLPSMNQSF